MPSLPNAPEPEVTPASLAVERIRQRATTVLSPDAPSDTRTVALAVMACVGAAKAPGIWSVIGVAAAALLGLDAVARKRYSRSSAVTRQGQEVK